jgi:hypothetical protein
MIPNVLLCWLSIGAALPFRRVLTRDTNILNEVSDTLVAVIVVVGRCLFFSNTLRALIARFPIAFVPSAS